MAVILFITLGIGGKEQEKIDSLAHGILYSIKHLNPDKIIFFGSNESKRTLTSLEQQYENEKNQKLENYEFIDITNQIDDFDACFTKIQKKLKKNEQNNEIIFDYTSGTKTMTMSIAICSMLYNKKLILVSGKREAGIVIKGTEKIIEQNLYSAYDKVLFDKVKELFNLNKFDEAKNILNQIIVLDKKQEYENLTNAYKSWDLFKHKEAFELLRKLSIEKDKISKNKGFIGKITYMIEEEKFEEKTKLLLIDLINNAERRIKEGKYDDAVARLYRAFELIAQIKLLELGLIDEIRLKDNKIFAILLEKLKEKTSNDIVEKYKEYQKPDDTNNGVIKIALKKDYELLSDLKEELGNVYKELEDKKSKISKLLKNRNNSILAHGLEPVEKQTAEELFEEVKKYSKILIPNIEEKLKQAEFPKI